MHEDQRRAGTFTLPLECSLCAGELVLVNSGGEGIQTTGVASCTGCRAEFAIVCHMILTCAPGCGTDAGWMRHRRRGEDACERCRVAHNDAQAERKRARSCRELVST